MHLSRQWNCWSLRCSWSIACRCCSDDIFILHLTPGFNGLGRDNCKMRRETSKCWDLVCIILEVWLYAYCTKDWLLLFQPNEVSVMVIHSNLYASPFHAGHVMGMYELRWNFVTARLFLEELSETNNGVYQRSWALIQYKDVVLPV